MEGLFQPWHLVAILLIALLLFGPKRLPELGKSIGEGLRGLKDSMKSRDDVKPEAKSEAKPESKPENKA